LDKCCGKRTRAANPAISWFFKPDAAIVWLFDAPSSFSSHRSQPEKTALRIGEAVMHVEEIGPVVRLRGCARIAAVAIAVSVAMLAGMESTATAKAVPVAFAPPAKVDKILVLKSARKLQLFTDGIVVKTYPIALGAHPIGPKRVAGDGKTPEGIYTIDARQPHSRYHLALHISYPNSSDRASAAAADRDPGGDIEIHGLPGWYGGPLNPVHFEKDWTHGCISVGDGAIEEIYAAVELGTPIEIRP
jgi:murein L,D-transpeptidase YafK